MTIVTQFYPNTYKKLRREWDLVLKGIYCAGVRGLLIHVLQVRVWTRPTWIDYVDTALNATARSIEAMETYTGIAYPLPKMGESAVKQV